MNAGTAYCKFIIIECGVHLNLPVLPKYEYNGSLVTKPFM